MYYDFLGEGYMRILVLEDDLIQRENLIKLINRNYIDIKAYEAGTVKEAKSILNEKEIDLFLVDINLPDGSGIEFAKEIRKIEKHEFTGIIFITTQVIQIIEAFKSTHCYDFIVKPYNEEEIKKIINSFYKKIGDTGVDKGDYIIVPVESGVSVKVYEEEIVFVEYTNRKSIIYTTNQIIESKSLSLNSILKSCNNEDIIQSHKSYLVNVKYIDKIERVYSKLYNIYFTNNENVAQLSNSYKESIMSKWGKE